MSNPIQYTLPLGGMEIFMNDLIGKEIEIKFLHQIHCIRCGSLTTTSFAQGYCYPCFRSAPETEDCVLRPELCLAHEGIARDMKYAETHCLIDHYVYLAYTSGMKVGVTRHTQIPTRWIDQGASQAIKLAKTPNRYLAGCIEVDLKAHFNDKTNWRKMLSDENSEFDMTEAATEAAKKLSGEYQKYLVRSAESVQLEYPVRHIPNKLSSLSLDKHDTIRSRLAGIKGQYLIFESGEVMNLRKHNGYLVEMSY
ncbi:MAG: DUF2797 domain-containing protein [Bacteroidales bacterium]|nr:DUF2797 domain-containing protein [Bacteroidales bacterium]